MIRSILDVLGALALVAAFAWATVLAVSAHAEWVDRRDREAWERGPCVCECGGGR